MENIYKGNRGDNAPVLVVTDNDGYLVHVGDALSIGNDTILEYVFGGLTLKSMPINEFRAMKKEWYYDKPLHHQQV